eukprot:1223448-Pleurochrysis_carterae.AAC.1
MQGGTDREGRSAVQENEMKRINRMQKQLMGLVEGSGGSGAARLEVPLRIERIGCLQRLCIQCHGLVVPVAAIQGAC